MERETWLLNYPFSKSEVSKEKKARKKTTVGRRYPEYSSIFPQKWQSHLKQREKVSHLRPVSGHTWTKCNMESWVISWDRNEFWVIAKQT